MSLAERVQAAFEKASANTDPADRGLDRALEAAVDAEAREQLAELDEQPDLSRHPTDGSTRCPIRIVAGRILLG